jgi:hypothetical protein
VPRKIILGILALIVVLVLGVVVTGYLLPREHVATRERTFAVSPDALHSRIVTADQYPRWRTGVTRVEVLEPEGGKPKFREINGGDAITYVFDELSERRIVSRIADPSLPFGGTWTYELEPSGTGTLLRITERGDVRNPVFRFVSRFIMGHDATINAYMDDLARVTANGR